MKIKEIKLMIKLNFEQFKNIEIIMATSFVLKFDKSKLVMDLQLPNIVLIVLTPDVLKYLSKSICFTLVKLLNKLFA